MPYLVTIFLIRWTMQSIHQNPAFAGFVRPATGSTTGSATGGLGSAYGQPEPEAGAAARHELVTAPR
jgi:hypothetical protein